MPLSLLEQIGWPFHLPTFFKTFVASKLANTNTTQSALYVRRGKHPPKDIIPTVNSAERAAGYFYGLRSSTYTVWPIFSCKPLKQHLFIFCSTGCRNCYYLPKLFSDGWGLMWSVDGSGFKCYRFCFDYKLRKSGIPVLSGEITTKSRFWGTSR